MTIADFDALVSSWEQSGVSTLYPGATDGQLQQTAQVLGRQLPEEFLDLYARCNGADILQGNIQLYPLESNALSVVRASDFLRDNGWPIPPELVVFAGNGAGDSFGLWMPTEKSAAPIIIEVGAIFEEGSLAVTGTSLQHFLVGRTAYYLLLLECPGASLDRLGVPERFRARQADELGELDYDALMRWADPGLPKQALSSYDARLTAGDVRRLANGAG